MESWARENGIIPGAIMEIGTLEGILGFVASGMGLTLFPISVVEKLKRKKSVRTHVISEEYGQVSTVFIRRKNSLLTKAVQALIDSFSSVTSCT
jgi:DNA-binding transcriptional LysR family regulator